MDKQSITIRWAMLDDAPALARLGAQTFQEAFACANKSDDMAAYLASAFSVSRVRAELEDRNALFLVAETSREAVGYAKLLVHEAPDCVSGSNPTELARLYIRNDWLGRGVGTALMQVCIREAEARKHGALWLGVWENNQRARTFYHSWGFTDVGSHEFVLGEDVQTDILMERPI